MTLAQPFDFMLDTEIRFGLGRRREVGEVVSGLGRRAVLVTGARSLERGGFGHEIRASLTAAGVELVDHVTTGGEPDDEAVHAAAERLVAARPDAVVTVGGGSTMDLAKAAAIVAGGADLGELLAGEPVPRPIGPPVVALPTTAGTGAEVSRGAILFQRDATRKRAIRGRGVAPRVAIVDPELTLGADRSITAEAGFDAAAHALETAVSRAASPLNIALAGDALRRLLQAVPQAIAEPDSIDARSGAAYAALLMGINLATASTCLPHRMQYALAGFTDASHARGVAAIMPAWLRRTRVHAVERLDELAVRCGVSPTEPPGVGADRLIERIGDWMREIGMVGGLASLGVRPDQVADIVSRVEGTLANDPGPTAPSDLAELAVASL
ncbi:MAG TPA: iron-containing alcohol dehydrogenase [Methylomirabilota bacterium]|nr:iron-containing alcohol dehydrogenase [Methylomirabilota bacterium]